MPTRHFRWAAPLVLLVLAACSDTPDPWSQLPNPPLVQARLHTVTIAGETARAREEARDAGYVALNFAPNYSGALSVEASLWDVPEPVAAKAVVLESAAKGPNLRFLDMSLAARDMKSSAKSEQSFFRNVLGTDVPEWPAGISRDSDLRVQVWTYFVPSLAEASQRLRENGIAATYDPIIISSSYLGEHKTMAIRAPDGTIVELVESAAR
jgi:hypothetical protein